MSGGAGAGSSAKGARNSLGAKRGRRIGPARGSQHCPAQRRRRMRTPLLCRLHPSRGTTPREDATRGLECMTATSSAWPVRPYSQFCTSRVTRLRMFPRALAREAACGHARAPAGARARWVKDCKLLRGLVRREAISDLIRMPSVPAPRPHAQAAYRLTPSGPDLARNRLTCWHRV